MPKQLTPEIITAAIVGFEQQKLQIDTQIAELRAMLSGGSNEPAATPKAPTGKRRKMSAAGRKAIAEAQRKRWAAAKKATEPAPAPSKPKRKLSKERKAALVANLAKARAARAAKRAEAAKAEQAKRGWATCRCSTASWWRSTRISASLAAASIRWTRTTSMTCRMRRQRKDRATTGKPRRACGWTRWVREILDQIGRA